MECGDLSPLWSGLQNESGDKSPHSKRTGSSAVDQSGTYKATPTS